MCSNKHQGLVTINWTGWGVADMISKIFRISFFDIIKYWLTRGIEISECCFHIFINPLRLEFLWCLIFVTPVCECILEIVVGHLDLFPPFRLWILIQAFFCHVKYHSF
ncbi:hypothetical protein D3C72_2017510 [compost metagenome]